MKIEFPCRNCKAVVTGDPAFPLRCIKCNESYAGDVAYQGALATVEQCAICRGSNLVEQTWSQRYVGPGTYFVFFLMIIPTRGLSLLLPILIRWGLDQMMPRNKQCRECGCRYLP